MTRYFKLDENNFVTDVISFNMKGYTCVNLEHYPGDLIYGYYKYQNKELSIDIKRLEEFIIEMFKNRNEELTEIDVLEELIACSGEHSLLQAAYETSYLKNRLC